MKIFCAAVLMAASAFAENIAPQYPENIAPRVSQQFVQYQHQQPQYHYAEQRQDVINAGPWRVVPQNQPPPPVNPIGFRAGFGLDAYPALKWGLAAVLIMLIVSTVLSVGKKIWPKISDMINVAEEARSMEHMSSLAQYAFEAFEKYQALNDEDNE